MSRTVRKIWLSLLLVAFLLVLCVPLLSMWFGGDQTRFPIRHLRVDSPFHHVTAEQIAALIQPELKRGIVMLDLKPLRAQVMRHPWIKRVEIRKRWPDALHIVVQERRALARWGDAALLDEDGEVFAPPAAALMSGLARLSGPKDKRADVLQFYQLADPNLRELGLHMTQAHFSSRGGLSVKLSSGAKIIVGREDINARWQRLMEALPTLIGPENVRAGKQLQSVDLRYTNGMAITFRKPDPASPAVRDAPAEEPSSADPALPDRASPAIAQLSEQP
jgi:cell division protein FtsQ